MYGNFLLFLVGNTVMTTDSDKSNSKLKALEDLDALGETLLKENLSGKATATSRSVFNRYVSACVLFKHNHCMSFILEYRKKYQ